MSAALILLCIYGGYVLGAIVTYTILTRLSKKNKWKFNKLKLSKDQIEVISMFWIFVLVGVVLYLLIFYREDVKKGIYN